MDGGISEPLLVRERQTEKNTPAEAGASFIRRDVAFHVTTQSTCINATDCRDVDEPLQCKNQRTVGAHLPSEEDLGLRRSRTR
jgi:hypothetical protein